MSFGPLGNEESILESPTYALALILLGFQIAAMLFTFVVTSLKNVLRHHKRFGMLAAVEHSVMELTLLGFISLCLIAFQGPLSNICVTASSSRAEWAILNNIIYEKGNCDCCLKNTAFIQACTLDHSKCGNPNDNFCNCDGQNPSCVAPIFIPRESYTSPSISSSATAPTQDGAHSTVHARRLSSHPQRYFVTNKESRRRSLLSGSAGEGLSIEQCIGPVSILSGCPPGKMPAVSLLALEQVHLLIFTVSVTHVLCGFLLYFAAAARLRFQWNIWDTLDDPHTRRVNQILENYFNGLNATIGSSSIKTKQAEEEEQGRSNRVKGGDVTFNQSTTLLSDTIDNTDNTDNTDTIDSVDNDVEHQRVEQTTISPPPPLSPFQSPPPTIGSSSSTTTTTNTTTNTTTTTTNTTTTTAPTQALPSVVRILTKSKSRKMRQTETLPKVLRIMSRSMSRKQRLLSEEHRINSMLQGSFNFDRKKLTRLEKFVAWLKETFLCMMLAFSPRVVLYEQYVILRSSFLYTHKLGQEFAFSDHVHRSLEDDLSHIVGLSIEFWLVSILFVFVSGPYGYAIMPFIVLAACILVPTNAKLIHIIRSVANRGGAQQLSSGVFWLNKPQLMLIPIKLCLFLCSFIYAGFIFFAWQFGTKSCPFNDAFYPNWVLPWWTIIIVNTIIFIHMGAVTLPAYSLAVQMGSDLKAYMLPQKLTKKLLAVAAAAKEQVKAQEKLRKDMVSSKQGIGQYKSFLMNGVSMRPSMAPINDNDMNTSGDGDVNDDVLHQDSGVRRSETLRQATLVTQQSKFDRLVSVTVRHLVGENHEKK